MSLGFLPRRCYTLLPNKYKFMQPILDNLAENVCEDIRPIMDELPKYNKSEHSIDNVSYEQQKFMYCFLSMAASRYYGADPQNNAAGMPEIIEILLGEISEEFGIKPTITNAAIILWNWKYIDETKPFSLENIEVLITMTGEMDEIWFYKIMIAIEGIGGRLLNDITAVRRAIDEKNDRIIKKFMVRFLNTLKECTVLLRKIKDHCRPDFFFNKLRMYLGGSLGSRGCQGWSIAQSTLFQIFDILLGVVHDDYVKHYLDEMQLYMPIEHRQYLLNIHYIKLSSYIRSGKNNELIALHNKCVDKLRCFRQIHINLINDYILVFSEMGLGGTNSIEFGTKVTQNVANARINRPLDVRKNTFIMIAIFIVIVIRYKIMYLFNNYNQDESGINIWRIQQAI